MCTNMCINEYQYAFIHAEKPNKKHILPVIEVNKSSNDLKLCLFSTEQNKTVSYEKSYLFTTLLHYYKGLSFSFIMH